MSSFKWISQSERLRPLLCWLGAQYIRVVWATGRWPVVGGEYPARFWDQGEPFIVAFWHGRLLLVPPAWPKGKPVRIVISGHRDGEIIARIIAHHDFGAIRGSSGKTGAVALRAALRLLKTGEYLGVTPDGPRGPYMRASDGVIAIARLSGVPIVPMSYSARRRKVLNSWDRFLLPLPFGGGAVVWGAPIRVPEKADAAALESARLELEESLNRLTREADRLCGHPPMEPAVASA